MKKKILLKKCIEIIKSIIERTINKKSVIILMKCKKDIESINAKFLKAGKKTIVLSKCPMCNSKSRFIIKQEVSRLLSKLGIRTPLSIIPLLGDIFL